MLRRVDRKCDRILSELLILRHAPALGGIDDAIDRLHGAAVNMRRAALEECRAVGRRYPRGK